jgi:hypothetical protein
MASITTHKSNGDKAGESPKILCEMLQYLGYQERPLYQGFKEVVNDREEWRVEVFIHTQKPNKPLIIEAACRRATFFAGIRDAACQAMYRLRDMYADDLSTTPYHYFPRRRICNTEKEILHYYKKKHHHQHDTVLIQLQIRLTMALVAVCDDAFDELREARCKIRELEEELRKAPRHKHNKAIAASSPPPHRRVTVGDKKPYQSPGHKAVTAPAPAPAARKRTSVVVGNTNRRACLSLQRKPAPIWGRRGAAPAPCGRRLARGVVNEDSVSSFGGGGSSSSAHQLPQGQGNGYRPPIASTQKSFLMHPVPVAVPVEGPHPRRDGVSASSSSFEGRMHGSNLMAVAVEGPRRDGAPPSSSSFEGRMHGRKWMAFILDGGVALGKEPANANNSDDATTSAAAGLFWENMEKPCSSAWRRRLL